LQNYFDHNNQLIIKSFDMVIDEINCFQYGAIEIICDTLGGGGLAKVSPNITWGGGGGQQKWH
jgi:hypothetical protein